MTRILLIISIAYQFIYLWSEVGSLESKLYNSQNQVHELMRGCKKSRNTLLVINEEGVE